MGGLLAILAIVCMVGAMILGIPDGIKNNFSFLQFFSRFAIMLFLLKLFDIVFLIGFYYASQTFSLIIIRK